MTTWQSDSTGSSSRSSRYDLNENDRSNILVYRPRQGVTVQSMESLCKMVNKDTRLRVSKKPIPRGNSRVEVRNEDLYNEPQKSEYQKYPNIKNSLASIGLPSGVYWKRLILNRFPNLYIVSPESSPENSPTESPESSQHVSPHSTFPKDGVSAKDQAKPERASGNP